MSCPIPGHCGTATLCAYCDIDDRKERDRLRLENVQLRALLDKVGMDRAGTAGTLMGTEEEVRTLKTQLSVARRTAEYWKVGHWAGTEIIRKLCEALIVRRAMEPRHSDLEHTCPECELLADIIHAEQTNKHICETCGGSEKDYGVAAWICPKCNGMCG